MRRERGSCLDSYQVDACVVGAGAAGCTAAITLSKLGIRVLLVARPSAGRVPTGESLTPKVRCILEEQDLWPAFLELPKIESPGVVAIWGTENPSEYDYFGSVHDVGWHIDRPTFDDMLFNVAQNRFDVPVVKLSSIRRITSVKDQLRLECHSVCKKFTFDIRTRFVMDATGRKAAVARQMGAHRKRADRQIAVGVIMTDNSAKIVNDHRLTIEAVEYGWWYTAPLPKGRRVVVLVTDSNLFPSSQKLSIDFWRASLRSTILIQSLVRQSSELTEFFTTAADVSWLDSSKGNNWVAIGDACLSNDPLSGQGTYQAMRSGVSGARAVVDTLKGKRGALDTFQQNAANQIDTCVNTRNQLWLNERRWPNSPFWAGRQSLASDRPKILRARQ